MPFEFSNIPRIAIIGSGAAGLAAAYELSPFCQVTLFEANDRLGGHARTVMAGPNRDVAVDTGFIVFNEPNYPHLTKMFADLDVPIEDSNMGFAASIGGGKLEYGLSSVGAALAQKRNAINPNFLRMLLDITKFFKEAEAAANDPHMSVAEFLDRLDMGPWFRNYYLLPISGAIWSSTPEQMAHFPAKSLVQFFRNHSLLSARGHQWRTVDGGSIEYVRRIEQAILAAGARIRLSTPVQAVRRGPDGVTIKAKGAWEEFDQVVFASHADQSLAMLDDASAKENEILGCFGFQDNSAVLHADARLMPQRRRAWASWVFKTKDLSPQPKISLTYWMNSLQNISDDTPMFLSLNPSDEIDERLIYDRAEFRHPVFNGTAIHAQPRLDELQGVQDSWFCGAWTKWGFHEDAYGSGVKVAAAIKDRMLGAHSHQTLAAE